MKGIEKLSPQEVIDRVSPEPNPCAEPKEVYDVGEVLRKIDPDFDEFPLYRWTENEEIKRFVFFLHNGELANGTMDLGRAYAHIMNGCVMASTLWVYNPKIG
ncbi:hypothetical protein SYK_02420 [Pseudodesulfovibrio nedwellii]|uniref:Uncharacterized protein n=1 Tax=Pseudodesulfovibrio nedwellii TaxID=2973072 RepID=A0ABM8AWH4_9BACT|nr:hypothetical protein [Pseudodesulfovibrio nedwellii]BDQ35882.1 hypothetical protein SYK_02420 [Pseudodesulfovibrio nedwellii]